MQLIKSEAVEQNKEKLKCKAELSMINEASERPEQWKAVEKLIFCLEN